MTKIAIDAAVVRQALEALDALYINDYSGYECSKHEAEKIGTAKHTLRHALEAAPQECPDAKRLDWLENNVFTSRWNGVIDSGSRTQWGVAPDYRHKTHSMCGNTFRAAIDAAMSATAPAQGGATSTKDAS